VEISQRVIHLFFEASKLFLVLGYVEGTWSRKAMMTDERETRKMPSRRDEQSESTRL